MAGVEGSATVAPEFGQLEQHRRELTAYCYRMLGSPFEAEDAVQETLLRAWREPRPLRGPRRPALLALPHRDECLPRHAQRTGATGAPDGSRPAHEPVAANLNTAPGGDLDRALPDRTPAESVAESRETIRLAFVAALQHLPPRQRAVLILCEVLRWKAVEVAELLDTSVASVNSALQRARATLERPTSARPTLWRSSTSRTASCSRATSRRSSATTWRRSPRSSTRTRRSRMPPYDLWLSGRDDILSWWVGPGAACRGSRVIPTVSANGSPAFGQYKPSETGEGLRALGAAGARDLRRTCRRSSRSSSAPRPSSRSSGCPPVSTRTHVAPGRRAPASRTAPSTRMAEAHLQPDTPSGELKSRQCVDRALRREPARVNVAHERAAPMRPHQLKDACGRQDSSEPRR